MDEGRGQGISYFILLFVPIILVRRPLRERGQHRGEGCARIVRRSYALDTQGSVRVILVRHLRERVPPSRYSELMFR